MGHSDATFAEAAVGYRSGAKGITHIFNAMRGMHHREPGIAGFGLINKDIYVEVIADPFHLHPGIIDLILRSKAPERIIIVSDTVKGAKLLEGGVKDAGGILLGGCMTVTEAAERLAARGVLRDDIMKAITENPERYLNN
jgi:N-acetylglucosamine-6-phosphate deacetylase